MVRVLALLALCCLCKGTKALSCKECLQYDGNADDGDAAARSLLSAMKATGDNYCKDGAGNAAVTSKQCRSNSPSKKAVCGTAAINSTFTSTDTGTSIAIEMYMRGCHEVPASAPSEGCEPVSTHEAGIRESMGETADEYSAFRGSICFCERDDCNTKLPKSEQEVSPGTGAKVLNCKECLQYDGTADDGDAAARSLLNAMKATGDTLCKDMAGDDAVTSVQCPIPPPSKKAVCSTAAFTSTFTPLENGTSIDIDMYMRGCYEVPDSLPNEGCEPISTFEGVILQNMGDTADEYSNFRGSLCFCGRDNCNTKVPNRDRNFRVENTGTKMSFPGFIILLMVLMVLTIII